MYKREKNNIVGSSEFGASIFASETAPNYAEASKIAFDGMEVLKNVAGRLSNVDSGQSQGHLFEYIESTKFNMSAALKSSDIRSFVTAAEGNPHSAADMQIRLGDIVLHDVQAKSYRNPAESLFAQSHNKYEGMQRVSPSEQYEDMLRLGEKRIATGTLKSEDYQDTLDNLKPSLRHKDIQSSGTTREEALKAVEHPKEYTRDFKINATTNEAAHAMGNAALAGGAITGAISLTRNIISYKTGEVDLQQASINLIQDVGKGAARSSLVAGTSVLIKNVALDQGLGVLAKSNITTAIAVTAINTSKSIIKFARGEIGIEEMTIEIGQSGASSGAGLYFGIAGAAVGGPVGAMVGSMVGYMVANISYQTVVEIFNTTKLTEAQYERMRPICDNAIYELNRTKKEFEGYMNRYFKESNELLWSSFNMIDGAIDNNDLDGLSIGLFNVISIFGRELQFRNINDFNDFIIDEHTTLEL